MKRVSSGSEQGSYTSYSILGNSINYWKESSDTSFLKESYYGDFRNLFVVNLDTSARLTICKPPNNINRNAPKQHPIHYAAFDSKYRKWLTDSFKKAFGVDVTPNTQYGASIPLCIGEPVKLEGKYEDEQQRLEEYSRLPRKTRSSLVPFDTKESGDYIAVFFQGIERRENCIADTYKPSNCFPEAKSRYEAAARIDGGLHMKRVPFAIIKAAKKFDAEAVEFVFRHFEGFIASQCLIDCTDEYGNTHSCVDDDLYYQAQIALFRAIAGFQFREPPDDFMP